VTLNLVIRIGTAADAPALRRLNKAFNGGNETPERIARRLAEPRCVETPILAEVGGQAIGFAALRVLPGAIR
jgi:hypothetical protein